MLVREMLQSYMVSSIGALIWLAHYVINEQILLSPTSNLMLTKLFAVCSYYFELCYKFHKYCSETGQSNDICGWFFCSVDSVQP